ncbi:hypothetical protein DCO58_01705 [Helicobacter saguini]|uniref:Uncharacterized protein n=2 Tax=Helicobacter saguini TaxID=1548018 RepID=A0A347VRH1_9HELI|nr:hypothetical protein [Helicobacter saguini]MWV66427.1 hypothetical protein [Helicobacter saguini]MWV71668.1 hypothetical protein [Helicobacter saguini]TLD94470.1 hypothetical protein LS64_005960 [Helicobacter saguini]
MGLIKSVTKRIKNSNIYKNYRLKRKEKGAFERDLAFFITRHKNIFGYTPDFANPRTFNEKIIHRILFDRNPLYTFLADKLKARIYISYKLRDFAASNNTGGGG